MYAHLLFPHQTPFFLSPTDNAVPEHHNSSSEGSEQYPFGAPAAAGDALGSDGSSDSDIGSLAANDEPYLPGRSQPAPVGRPSPLAYTVAPDYLSGHSGGSASPGHHRSYSNGQNDNGYSGGYPSQYGQSSRTSNDAYDYTRDGPYVPPGFYHPPPLSAQSHRHFAYQRPQQPSIPPPQPIPHPLIAPQVQQDLPYSPSTSSDSSDEGSYRPSYLHQARSSMPASPSHSQLPPNPHESIHIHIPDEPPHTGGSEPPADVQEEPEHSQTWHETDRYLRNQIGIPEGTRVDLWALPDPPSGHKPQQPLPILVKLAIHGCEKGMLTLQEIYQTLEDRFEYFARLKSSAWKNSIRHNLSLNQVFRSCDRPITEPGKGRYWSLDISKGEGYKRERRRKRRNAAPYNGTRDLPGGVGNQFTPQGDSSDPDHEMDDDTVAPTSGKAAKTKKGRKRGPYTRITVAQPSVPGSTGITAGGAAAATMVGAPDSAVPSPMPTLTAGAGPSFPPGADSMMYHHHASGSVPPQPSSSTVAQPLAPPLSHMQQQTMHHHHAPATLPYPIGSYPQGMYFNRPTAPTFGQSSLPAPGSFAAMVRTTSQPPSSHVGGSGVGTTRKDPSVISISSDSGSSPGSEMMLGAGAGAGAGGSGNMRMGS